MTDNIQTDEVLRQIEREVRMREGSSKLLAACSQRGQALEASKSLLTCNTRILALLGQLQKMRKAQILQRVTHRPSEDPVPCVGKVAISDLRIPLMWKDSEYFKNKGELHRCAVFCLLQCGTEIQDTGVVMVDRTLTDICFEDTIVFNNVGPEFQLRVELYSARAMENFPPGVVGQRRGVRLGGSLGCYSGRKIRTAFESATLCGYISTGGDVRSGSLSPPLFPYLSALGPKYNVLAHTTLTIEHVQEGFKTHDLLLSTTEESRFWLPLYGSMCCRLVAQPLCMIQPAISGQLKVKLDEDSDHWENVYGVLRRQTLICCRSPADLESDDQSSLVIPIKKDTVVGVSEEDAVHRHHIRISTQCQGETGTYTLAAHTAEDAQRWNQALWQHIYNLSKWKQSCDDLMKIDTPSPRKSLAVKQGSLYHEIVTPSSPRKGTVVPDIDIEIRALLSSYHKESY